IQLSMRATEIKTLVLAKFTGGVLAAMASALAFGWLHLDADGSARTGERPEENDAGREGGNLRQIERQSGACAVIELRKDRARILPDSYECVERFQDGAGNVV